MAIFGLQVEYKDNKAATELIPKEYRINKTLLYSRRIKDQLDITCYFISLLMCSTCFGH